MNLPTTTSSQEEAWVGWVGGRCGWGGSHIAQAGGSVPTPMVIAVYMHRLPWKVIPNAVSITSELAGRPSILRKGLLFNGAKECVFLGLVGIFVKCMKTW